MLSVSSSLVHASQAESPFLHIYSHTLRLHSIIVSRSAAFAVAICSSSIVSISLLDSFLLPFLFFRFFLRFLRLQVSEISSIT